MPRMSRFGVEISAGPVASAVMRIQAKAGVECDGIVGERTLRAATRLGYALHYDASDRCSCYPCPNECPGPFWLIVFGSGRLGVFVRCCQDHPLEPGFGEPAFPFPGPDGPGALCVMEGVRAVHEVMAS